MTTYTVSVSQLKSRLSFYIKQAQNGDTILIARRGKPIAWLTQSHFTNPRVSKNSGQTLL